MDITILIHSIIAGATPVLLATLGETITEKAGIINLSLDGTIMLSAMVAFAVAVGTENVFYGFITAAIIGALAASLVAYFSIYLHQSQVAVGFVLTLMLRELAYFLGNPYCRIPGPQVTSMPIPLLRKIPLLGPVLFNHALPVYLGLLLIGISWWYIYRTPFGLRLRAVGESPEASFARGINPRKVQMTYALLGGLLVGLAGAVFSLSIKPGWGRPQGAEGTGWIAIALVIFGGWNPIRAAMGAYLFSLLQVLGISLQDSITAIPAQVFQVAPFPLMIFTLVLLNLTQKTVLAPDIDDKSWWRSTAKLFYGRAPAALGKPYQLS